jgi:hypothetical protein
MNDVLFKFNGCINSTAPLKVKVANRVLSLAGDNNCSLEYGADYTRTDIVLLEGDKELLQVDLVTPQMLFDAMQWVMTGDLTFIFEYV